MAQATGSELADVIDRAREERLRLLQQLREVESRIGALARSGRPPEERVDALVRRIDDAESRLAARLADLSRAEAVITRHTDAANRVEASLSKLSAAFNEQLEVVRPAVQQVGQIKQQLRDAAHSAIEQTRTAMDSLRSPVMEELARLEATEASLAEHAEAARQRVEAAMHKSVERAGARMKAMLEDAREQARTLVAEFAAELARATDQRVDERVELVNQQLDHHLRAVNHRLLAQQQQINDVLDRRQETTMGMLADAESVIEQCGQQFDEAQRHLNRRLADQRQQLAEVLAARQREAVEAAAAAIPTDTGPLVEAALREVEGQLQRQAQTVVDAAAARLRDEAGEICKSFAAMLSMMRSRAARQAERTDAPEPAPPPPAPVAVATTPDLGTPMQAMADRLGARPRPAARAAAGGPDSSLHLG